jgi:hypothetical protein
MDITLPTRIMLMLSISVMVMPAKAQAQKARVAKEILGIWCSYGSGQTDDERSYLRNDASAANPDTPRRRGGDTEWIVFDSDGSYHGRVYDCRTMRVVVIDRGIVIKGRPGANAVYGLDAQCKGKIDTWGESTRIEVERWGSALTIKRTKVGLRSP